MKQPTLSIIIPAYNEEKRLPRCLSQSIPYLQQQPFESEIIVVTDGSKDRTADAARSFAGQFANLRVLEFTQNRGKGFGVREGMMQARGKYRLFMDADLAVSFEYAKPFLERMEKEN